MTPLLLQLPPNLFSLCTVELFKDWPHSLPPVSLPAGSTQTNQMLTNLTALLSSPYHILNSSMILKTINKIPSVAPVYFYSIKVCWQNRMMTINTGWALYSVFFNLGRKEKEDFFLTSLKHGPLIIHTANKTTQQPKYHYLSLPQRVYLKQSNFQLLESIKRQLRGLPWRSSG